MRPTQGRYKQKANTAGESIELARNGWPILDVPALKRKLVRLLARRDYSQQELRERLRDSGRDADVEAALEWAASRQLLRPPLELATQVAGALDRKLKGAIYIREYLKRKDLPCPAFDREEEKRKALALFSRRGQRLTKEKFFRFLISRGFEPQVANEVVREKY